MFLILTITIFLFSLFVCFQLLYIVIPVFTSYPRIKRTQLLEKQYITILIPAYNEEKVVETSINNILNLDYPNFEVIIINDGSTDDTLNKLKSLLNLQLTNRNKKDKLDHKIVTAVYRSSNIENIFVIDKENGGKSDALNCGIEFANYEIIITLDADTILDDQALKAVNITFQNEEVIAAGGMVHILQVDKKSDSTVSKFNISNIVKYQAIQYMNSFYLHKITQSKLQSITVIAGAFGAFRQSVLLQINGYRETIGEDMDITFRIHQLINKEKTKKLKMICMPGAACYTECPEKMSDLFKQRFRWQKGFIDCILTHWKSFFIKMRFSITLFLLLDALILGTLTAFVILTIPIVIIITNSGYVFALIFGSISFILAFIQGIVALVVSRRHRKIYTNKEYIRIICFLPLEIISYRLLGIIFNTLGTLLYFRNKTSWNKVERIGSTIEAFPHQTIKKIV